MSDEEIQYVGSSPAKTAMQRPVTGIVLNVEKSADNEAYRLTFNRSEANVVPIGRRPGSDAASCIDSSGALFRCAVVSRKHAKIMFSDNTGHAYIIDLNSHHGTHIRKPGQLSSKMLVPELPMMLSDGDVITFGKTVGRNEECVRPVVARVELLRNPEPFKPLFIPSPASDKASSGRYGIYVSSGSSDEMLESEVEKEKETSCATKVLDAVRNLTLPPIGYVCDSIWDALPYPASSPWVNLPSLKEVLQTKSRSHSPMDLESPAPPVEEPNADIAALDRVIFGEEEASQPHPESEPKQVDGSSRESSPSSDDEGPTSSPSDINQVVEKLKDEINKLNAHRRKYRSRFNANVHTMALKLSEYDARIKELCEHQDALASKVDALPIPTITAQLQDVEERLGFVSDVDLPDLQAQVDNLDGELCDITDKHDDMGAVVEKANEMTQVAQNEIKRLEGLLDEMVQLRQKAHDQMEQALKEVKETSELTLKKLTEESAKMSESLAAHNIARPSLKRKRDDADDGEGSKTRDSEDPDLTKDDIFQLGMDQTAEVLSTEAKPFSPIVMDDWPVISNIDATYLTSHRPRKRLRKIASAFAQTATAVTLGAVVTWSALAFT